MLAMHRFSAKADARSSAVASVTVEPLNDMPRHRTLPKYWYMKHVQGLLGFGIVIFITFVIYDDFQCRAEPHSDCFIPGAFFNFGELAPGNWSQWIHTLYIALGYPAWGLGCALMANYAADGNGGVITRTLAHPVFLPLARLSYTVYLIHLLCMQLFYAKAPSAVYVSSSRQVLDAVGFAGFAFTAALGLYLLVERPFTSLLPWCFGFDKDERRTQRTRSTSVTLRRELSLVSDVDSESVAIATPHRRDSLDLEEPLISNTITQANNNANH